MGPLRFGNGPGAARWGGGASGGGGATRRGEAAWGRAAEKVRMARCGARGRDGSDKDESIDDDDDEMVKAAAMTHEFMRGRCGVGSWHRVVF